MRIELHPFEERDLPRLAAWARCIGADAHMSRTRPVDLARTGHCPEAGLLWYVICADGRDVGTIWLEREADHSSARLGILLGDEALFGRGIGTEAVRLVLERARSSRLALRKVVLHVRRDNGRAIGCYERCGFVTMESATKVRADGVQIEGLRMELQLERSPRWMTCRRSSRGTPSPSISASRCSTMAVATPERD
jgi:RimJ/RimL family protein N-acetyltransferase